LKPSRSPKTFGDKSQPVDPSWLAANQTDAAEVIHLPQKTLGSKATVRVAAVHAAVTLLAADKLAKSYGLLGNT
jgi:hypothetical protein